jgi:hypothetical protein
MSHRTLGVIAWTSRLALASVFVFVLAFVLAFALAPTSAWAEAQQDRFSAGGYYRIMTRPDLEGGNNQLGLWNLYGRLLNEGPYGMLSLKLNILQSDPSRGDVWATANVRIEGGSVSNADPGNGNLSNFRVSQLYVEAGNILFQNVTWRLGTLDYYSGDLGLYDMRPAELFNDAIGASGFYTTRYVDLMLAIGDAGYSIRGANYNTILTGGAWLRGRLGKHLEIGVGGQGYYEPQVLGNHLAPYQTPGITYEAFYRHEVIQDYLLANPGQLDEFPNPQPRSSTSWRLVGYLGFGGFGPLKWDNLFAHYLKQHPDNFYTENYNGANYTIYIHDFTDQRYETQIGNEAQITLWPGKLDAVWSMLYGLNRNYDNTIAAGEDNRWYASTVLRMQYYLTDKVHLLAEGSIAREHSLNGNLWREHEDSVFASQNGVADTRGLQYGDTDTRNTWQGKGGIVFSPLGPGIFTRPSLRLLYGIQYSNMQDAFGNSFTTSLSQFNQFPGVERHWHNVIALEAEGWF